MPKISEETQKTTNGWKQSNKTEQTQESTVEISESKLNDIVERLNKVESENQELRKKNEPSVKSEKETYKWPKLFNYKMWDWIPVLDYESTKLDTARPLVVRGQNGEYQSNHILRLTLADWNVQNVDVNEFNAYFERSEKLEPKRIDRENDEEWTIIGYVFEHPRYWEFTVTPKMIN